LQKICNKWQEILERIEKIVIYCKKGENLMLLEFAVENYKSFKEKVVFSMIPAPRQKGLDYSILIETANNKKYKALSSAVIYGANAAGKTNIIGAMDVFRTIVLRGNIRNSSGGFEGNFAHNLLELIPNNTLKKPKDVAFGIKFVDSNILFSYDISFSLGSFVEYKYKRRITSEVLSINGKMYFSRKNNTLEFGNSKDFDKITSLNLESNKKIIEDAVGQGVVDDELFLSNGFKSTINPSLGVKIYKFFDETIKPICNSQYFKSQFNMNNREITDKLLNEAVYRLGINSNTLKYMKRPNDSFDQLVSVFKNNKDDKDRKIVIPAEFIESFGTLRFVDLFPLLADIFAKGGILFIDEFGTSLHPMVIVDIINIFHNDKINKNHAQIIFTTQNPVFLNNNLFRRDEIKFVERDDETKCSDLYSLSDFGTKGTMARKGKDYMNNYFMNKYGAIRRVELSDIFEKIVDTANEEKITK
jgi:AAA15 family ATPase/GTPase